MSIKIRKSIAKSINWDCRSSECLSIDLAENYFENVTSGKILITVHVRLCWFSHATNIFVRLLFRIFLPPARDSFNGQFQLDTNWFFLFGLFETHFRSISFLRLWFKSKLILKFRKTYITEVKNCKRCKNKWTVNGMIYIANF